MTTPLGRMTPNRFAPSLIALFLACSALTTPAHAGWLFGGDEPQKTQDTPQTVTSMAPAPDIEGNVRQARMLRLAGQYKEAIHHLAQLMLVASDDGRVVAEYGKTLTQMGRAQDAVSFLTRASQLRADDWTIFSALGVAFDELGEQDKARDAYERALAIKPDEPSVLNNYALSRLLAHDPQGARALAERIRAAGGQSDPKIARNLAMIADLAPTPASDTAPAHTKANEKAAAPAKTAQASFTAAAPEHDVPTKAAATASTFTPAATTPQPRPARTMAVADNAPFVSLPATPPAAAPIAKIQTPTPLPKIEGAKIEASAPAPRGVVMQKVPVDPLAGPVDARKATGKPAALAKTDTPEDNAPGAEKNPEQKATENRKKPVRTAEQIRDSVPALRLSANAY